MDNFHKPVLLKEVIDSLEIESGGIYVDATIGGGGHAQEILKKGGKVIGIDQDKEALSHIEKKFETELKEGSLKISLGNFSEIGNIVRTSGHAKVDGILMDLGVSSFQIDKSERGFSFMRDEKLDMRMGSTTQGSAYEIINNSSEDTLYNIFSKYGEERKARDVAKAIVETRKEKKIATTGELTRIILKVIPRTGETHPATKIFQAIRIAVNDELSVLRIGLDESFKLLDNNGRLSVISFHSLEDRIVKLFMTKAVASRQAVYINKKPIMAGDDEIRVNRRARSAKLRTIKKYE